MRADDSVDALNPMTGGGFVAAQAACNAADKVINPAVMQPETMETKTVQFIKQRNYQAVVKDKGVRLRYVVFEQGSEQALAFRDDLFYLHGAAR